MPRSVCLKKASNQSNIDSENVVNSLIRPSDYSSESTSSSSSVVSDTSDGLTLRNLNRRNMEFADEYGFKLRGDSPVIISVVVPNSLADVSWIKKITTLCRFINCVLIIFYKFSFVHSITIMFDFSWADSKKAILLWNYLVLMLNGIHSINWLSSFRIPNKVSNSRSSLQLIETTWR